MARTPDHRAHPPPSPEPVRLLLVEDDDDVAGVVAAGLGGGRYRLDRASCVAEARGLLTRRAYDVLVLDVGLPDGSGLSVAESLRHSGSDLPIIMLTSRDSVDDRVTGLTRGADDYLCKPFAVQELSARIEAVLRRARGANAHELRFADVELDLIKRVAVRGELTLELSSREAELLGFFMRHPRTALPRETILEEVWGDEAEFGGNVLNVYVNYLRNKLEHGRYPRLIHTIRGVGYMLSDADPSEAPPPAGPRASR